MYIKDGRILKWKHGADLPKVMTELFALSICKSVAGFAVPIPIAPKDPIPPIILSALFGNGCIHLNTNYKD